MPARQIELLVLDVDGVLTDGGIIVDSQGRELKRFDVRDGFGIKLWQRVGLHVGAITGRSCPAVAARLEYLGIKAAVQGSSDKIASLEHITRLTGVGPAQTAFLGDDWPDLAIMRHVGYAMAVADAEPCVRDAAAFVTNRPGGRGAVRDAIEHLLHAKGLYEQALALYAQRTHVSSADSTSESTA